MICPKCKKEMELKDILICRTTDPKDDDLWEKRWVCEDCAEKELSKKHTNGYITKFNKRI